MSFCVITGCFVVWILIGLISIVIVSTILIDYLIDFVNYLIAVKVFVYQNWIDINLIYLILRFLDALVDFILSILFGLLDIFIFGILHPIFKIQVLDLLLNFLLDFFLQVVRTILNLILQVLIYVNINWDVDTLGGIVILFIIVMILIYGSGCVIDFVVNGFFFVMGLLYLWINIKRSWLSNRDFNGSNRRWTFNIFKSNINIVFVVGPLDGSIWIKCLNLIEELL